MKNGQKIWKPLKAANRWASPNSHLTTRVQPFLATQFSCRQIWYHNIPDDVYETVAQSFFHSEPQDSKDMAILNSKDIGFGTSK
jgi:hypothetical protein